MSNDTKKNSSASHKSVECGDVSSYVRKLHGECDDDPRFNVLIELLWDQMIPAKQHDRVETEWGSKTKVGLFLCVKRIMCSDDFCTTSTDSTRTPDVSR